MEAGEEEVIVAQELASAELVQEIIMCLLLPLKILGTSPSWVLNEFYYIIHLYPFGGLCAIHKNSLKTTFNVVLFLLVVNFFYVYELDRGHAAILIWNRLLEDAFSCF